jgi:predicted O-methyltransferase YrrM
VGELLYVLVVARRPATIVEFGASHGYSTIHLAAGVRDIGSGCVITTEMVQSRQSAGALVIADLSADDPDQPSTSSGCTLPATAP